MDLRPTNGDEKLPGYTVKPEPSRECQRAVPDADIQ